MAQNYSDQFYLIDAYDPPPSGTALSPIVLTITDNDEDSDFSNNGGDMIDGSVITAAYDGDAIRVQLPDGTNVDITGVTFVLADGRVLFTPTDQSVLEDATYQSTQNVQFNGNGWIRPERLMPVCFTSGTMLIGPDSEPVRIDDLKAGDELQVITQGTPASKAVRWIGRRTIGVRELSADPTLRPVRICAGSLGVNVPQRDLLVSPQHRLMTESRIAKRMFDESEILIPAIRLTELPGIYVDEEIEEVTYFHILFDEHEVLLAEGAVTESLFTGPEALRAVSPEARAEIMALFPQLANGEHTAEAARLIPPGHAQRKLIERHLKNGVPLFS